MSSMLLAIGAVCWLATVAGDAAHGVLMFPVLKRHSERAPSATSPPESSTPPSSR